MLHVTEYCAKSLKIIENGPFESGFLFAFHSNYGSVLYHFRDKAKYWPKSRFFHTPCVLQLGGPRQNIAIMFGIAKSTAVWLYTVFQKSSTPNS